MAKIKQTKIRLKLDLAHPWKETVVSICYDSTDRNTEQYGRPIPEERFYIVLPKVVADSLGYDKVRAKDQDEVMVRFKAAIERYKCLETEVNRVIVYKFGLSPHPKDSHFMNDGYRIVLSVSTYEETVMTAGDGAKRYSYEPFDSDINIGEGRGHRFTGEREETQVPYNDTNYAFFLWIKTNMKLLIDKLLEIEEPAKLLETIHAGRLLPLGEGKLKESDG